jgi:hypothetical protein
MFIFNRAITVFWISMPSSSYHSKNWHILLPLTWNQGCSQRGEEFNTTLTKLKPTPLPYLIEPTTVEPPSLILTIFCCQQRWFNTTITKLLQPCKRPRIISRTRAPRNLATFNLLPPPMRIALFTPATSHRAISNLGFFRLRERRRRRRRRWTRWEKGEGRRRHVILTCVWRGILYLLHEKPCHLSDLTWDSRDCHEWNNC